MKRRDFLGKAAIVAAAIPTSISAASQTALVYSSQKNESGIDPWLELSMSAYSHNAKAISQAADGKPVLAVLKNNAYGLGAGEVGKILDDVTEVVGYAVVKSSEAIAMRKVGVRKPILLMADFDSSEGRDLIEQNVTLAPFSFDSISKITNAALQAGRLAKVQLYIDTGLGRMGMPYHKTSRWLVEISNNRRMAVEGMFTTLTTPVDFAGEQIARFKSIINDCSKLGMNLSAKHTAPSYTLLRMPESHFDMVRPGILIHGSHPIGGEDEQAKVKLKPVFRLRARVVRMEQLRKGDTIGFSRFYTAERPVWIATVPIGWADGYASAAENGAMAMVNDKLYKVVNVNASHLNLEIGDAEEVKAGDIATLIGPDHAAITPQGFAEHINSHNYLQINFKESLPKFVHNTF